MNSLNDKVVSEDVSQQIDSMPLKSRKGKFEDRFGGLSESDLLERTLPDHLCHDLDILIIGINPGYTAAYKGHHYAGPGNHFWKCLYMSELISEPLNAYDDYKLIDKDLKYRIGFTNIVERTTRGSDCLTRNEIRVGSIMLKNKLKCYKPKVAVFNGKGIYEIFSGTNNCDLGLQTSTICGTNTMVYVMPSSSARCSHLPRAIDKLPYYLGLRKLLDQIRDNKVTIDRNEFRFEKLKSPVKRNRDKSSQHIPRDGDSDCSNSRVEPCLPSVTNLLPVTKLMNTSPDWTTNKTSCDKVCFQDEKISGSKVSLLNFSTPLITSHYFNKKNKTK